MKSAVFPILLIAGVLLICGEIFVPGGVLGSMGAIALMGAIVAAFFVFPAQGALLASFLIVLLLGIMIVLWIKLFPKSRMGRSMTLEDDGSSFKASQLGLSELIGKEGETKSDLRPAGFALIDGKRIDVVTEGGMIEKGASVKVVEVEGNRVVVRQIERS